MLPKRAFCLSLKRIAWCGSGEFGWSGLLARLNHATRKRGNTMSTAGHLGRSEGVKADSFIVLFILARLSDLRTAERTRNSSRRQLHGTDASPSLRKICPAIFGLRCIIRARFLGLFPELFQLFALPA
jgi:hypothetical protein